MIHNIINTNIYLPRKFDLKTKKRVVKDKVLYNILVWNYLKAYNRTYTHMKSIMSILI